MSVQGHKTPMEREQEAAKFYLVFSLVCIAFFGAFLLLAVFTREPGDDWISVIWLGVMTGLSICAAVLVFILKRVSAR